MPKSSTNTQKKDANWKNKARKLLARAPESKVFWCNDGRIFGDLEDMAEGLRRMSDETFTYHCNPNKNDFAIWVQEVIGDRELAESLMTAGNRQHAQRQVEERYSDLTRLEG